MNQLFPPLQSLPLKFKLFISNYELNWRQSSKAVLKGALCAFDFGMGERGYSDFLPWPLMGEKSLSLQFEELKKGKESRRFQITKYNAFLDAKARKEKKSLFFSLRVPPSHFLIEDIISFKDFERLKGFNKVKVKLKADLPAKQRALQTEALKEISQSFPALKWRLDLNAGPLKDWSLDFLSGKIDFIEDPDPADIRDGSLIAEDWLSFKKAPIRIVKPGRDFVLRDLNSLLSKKRIIFTHSFEHPLGQAITAFWAGAFYRSYPHFFETGGFLDFQLKALKKYPLKREGSCLSAPTGFGFGFTKALQKENWKRWL